MRAVELVRHTLNDGHLAYTTELSWHACTLNPESIATAAHPVPSPPFLSAFVLERQQIQPTAGKRPAAAPPTSIPHCPPPTQRPKVHIGTE